MMLVSVRWMTPVMIKFGNGALRQFDCVHDALDYLEHEWPSPPGKRHEKAVKVLGSALARLTPVDEARKAFVSACVECGILVPQAGATSRKARHLKRALVRDRLNGRSGIEAAG